MQKLMATDFFLLASAADSPPLDPVSAQLKENDRFW